MISECKTYGVYIASTAEAFEMMYKSVQPKQMKDLLELIKVLGQCTDE